jgi:hypothetical protein
VAIELQKRVWEANTTREESNSFLGEEEERKLSVGKRAAVERLPVKGKLFVW